MPSVSHTTTTKNIKINTYCQLLKNKYDLQINLKKNNNYGMINNNKQYTCVMLMERWVVGTKSITVLLSIQNL